LITYAALSILALALLALFLRSFEAALRPRQSRYLIIVPIGVLVAGFLGILPSVATGFRDWQAVLSLALTLGYFCWFVIRGMIRLERGPGIGSK
jgi:hypothetical protein